MRHEQSPSPTPDELFRCMNCGYNVRGVASDLCPECGSEVHIQVAQYDELGRFNAAAATLADAGIEFRAVQINPPAHALNQWMGTRVHFGSAAIHVNKVDYHRAKQIISTIDDGQLLPIVDRAEPACPSCSTPVDPQGPASCPACGTIFQWVQIGEPSIDPTGLHCNQCDYDLTGNASDRCPECGALIPKDLDALVAAATGDEPPTSGTQDAPPPPSTTRSAVSILLGGAFIVGVVSVGITIAWVTANPFLLFTIVVVAIGIAIGAWAVVKYLRDRHTN